jgi:cardiolipin synthase
MNSAHHRPIIALLALALLVPASGCTVFSRGDQREVYHFKHSFPVADPAFRRSLDTFGSAMVPGNRAEILNNGDEIFPAMVGAIQSAKVSVDLETYIFHDDRAGKLVADALIDAARRGVEVRLLVDGTGSHVGALWDQMKQAGVKAYVFHPIRLWSIYKIGRRTHRKILVADGTVCFTGGVGIADDWLGNARNPKEYRDMQVEVAGPAVAQMQAIFSEDWTYTTGELLVGDKFYPRLTPAGEVPAQAIKVARGDSSSLAGILYYLAIQSAEKSIFIQNAYFLPDAQVRAALIRAVGRGVDVRIMVPGKDIDVPLVRLASRRHYGELLQGGVKIYEYNGTMMHNKDAVVDGIFSTIGSINFDARSMRENAEESMAFYDREFAARLEATFAEDQMHCHEVSYEQWRKRGLVRRATELFSWFFQPLY